MDDDVERHLAAVEDGAELIRMATGILMERYGVSDTTSESALMDWSRISHIEVHELARRVVDDVKQRREQ